MSYFTSIDNPVLNEINSLPNELTQSASPLVFFTGLDIISNRNHLYIWESFNFNRANDRIPIRYQLIDNQLNFPHLKPKKTSYDWYNSKGIIKKNWMAKHLYQIPSLIVVFINLDWDDPDFNEKRIECVSRYEYIKNQIDGRNCKIALILIQEKMPVSTNDEVTNEKVSQICDSCDINAKSLFVLPIQDTQHFFVYILRMENAFFEFSCAYYQQEIKQIKNHKELLSKVNHAFLFVRHQFKMAFLFEMKQDFLNAIKNYKQAFVYLMEVPSTIVNSFEIKIIASFINYKICHLLFAQNDPREAISHFQKHVNIFKHWEVTGELEFEHFAWLAFQYSNFANLFEIAISSGLFPNQTQHPGYYYYESALYTIKRRISCKSFTKEVNDLDENWTQSFIDTYSNLEFYGQRAWRHDLKSLDIEREKKGIKVLQYYELKHVDHTALVISLLTNAMNHFKNNKCPRMMRYMKVLIAKEYFNAKDYQNCVNFINQVLPHYRTERWKPILASVLVTALSAAYLSAISVEYIKFSLEFISSWIPSNPQLKSIVQSSIISILNRELPPIISSFVKDSDDALNLWSSTLGNEKINLTFTLKVNTSFIEIKPQFCSPSFELAEKISFKVFFYLNCPNPIRFLRLEIIFNEPYYNQFCVITCDQPLKIGENESETNDESSLLFHPRELREFKFNFKPRQQDEGQTIKINMISLILGQGNRKVTLNTNFSSSEFDSKCAWYCINSGLNQGGIQFQSIRHRLETKIKKQKFKLKFNVIHQSPALLGEKYPIKLKIENEDLFDFQNLSLVVSQVCQSNQAEQAQMTLMLNEKSLLLDTPYFLFHELTSGSNAEQNLFLIAQSLFNQRFTFKLNFEHETKNLDYPKIKSSLIQEVSFQIISPFSISSSLFNLLNLPAKTLRAMESFVIKIENQLQAPFSVEIIKIDIEMEKNFFNFSSLENEFRVKLPIIMNPKDSIQNSFLVCSNCVIDTPSSMGNVVIEWKRLPTSHSSSSSSPSSLSTVSGGSGDNTINISKFVLPEIVIENSILYVETLLPKFGVTRQHLLLTYNIYNRTDSILPIELTIGNSDNFMYAGNKSVNLSILAKDRCTQYFILYPLICGDVLLPKLKIVAYPNSEAAISLDNVLNDILPLYLRVMPQPKSLS